MATFSYMFIILEWEFEDCCDICYASNLNLHKPQTLAQYKTLRTSFL